MDRLSADLWQRYIVPRLDPISYYAMWNTLSGFRHNCPQRFPTPEALCLERVEVVLRDLYGLDIFDWVPIMAGLRSGALALTGGLLLAILNGAKIDPSASDIDLCVVEPDVARHLGGVVAVCLEEGTDEPYAEGDTSSWRVRSMCISTRRIGQVVAVDLIMPVEPSGYLSCFDMAFCANLLCGTRRLYVKDLEAVVHRRCVVNTGGYLRRLTSLNACEYLASRWTKARARIARYRARGYEVELRHDRDVIFATLPCVHCHASEYEWQHYLHCAPLPEGDPDYERLAAWIDQLRHVDRCRSADNLWSSLWEGEQ